MKVIKRWFTSVFMMLIFILSLSNIFVVKADEATKLVIHYYRYDDNYTDMYMHLWQYKPVGKPGADVKMSTTKDDYGSVTVLDLEDINEFSNGTEVGIIIKRGTGWDFKDVGMDRFIDLSQVNENGEVHTYFVQGDARIGYSIDDPNGPENSEKVLSGYFKTTDQIKFMTTSAVTKDDVILLKNNVPITPASITMSSNNGTINLSDDVDFSSQYTLKINFNGEESTYNVTFDGIYDTEEFENAFYYDGELGAIYSQGSTTFKLWAPISSAVEVCLYDTGAPSHLQTNGDDTGECTSLTRGDKGVWSVTKSGNLHGKYYTYKVTNGSATHEVIDPYAVSAGVNGVRGMIVDFSQTNPDDWAPTTKPDTIDYYTDSIIYELHVRDLTTHSTWNGTNDYRGKFMGLTESGTTYQGVKTGLDHLIDLGINTLHLLPAFDFGVVDETRLNDPKYANAKPGIFNWGYMPLNFNMPEGSYSTDPYNGEVRINEYKQMVQTLHNNDIRVVMDVVYNHTGPSADSNFHLIIPGYYHRMTETGGFSNGSGTGNEFASERAMARKFMVDSLNFWATEYNIDGFRFDLMALHDVVTMNQIKTSLHEIDPTIIIYGEPWMGGSSVMDMSISAGKENIKNMPGVAAFSDDMRDAVKGSAMDDTGKGFIQGNFDSITSMMYGIVGGVKHPQLGDYNVWHTEPTQTVNYVSAHDNHTLYDKLLLTARDLKPTTLRNLQKQANAIVLTSQGIPFLHAGVDFMRTKDGDHNSYESSDLVNQLDWSLKAENIEVFNYYKGLIELRKSHPAFRMTTSTDIKDHLSFVNHGINGLVAYTINDYANNDTWENILVIHNGNAEFELFTLPEGDWNLVGNQTKVGNETIRTVQGNTQLLVNSNETMILYQGERTPDPEPTTPSTGDKDTGNNDLALIIGASVGSIVVMGGIFVFVLKTKKRN
jgi:pullulanase